MAHHAVKKGLDIPIAGRASGEPIQLDPPGTVAWNPTEFRGIVPKLAAREGDEVQVGSPLFFDKANPSIVFRSPVAGKVVEVRRGRRRVITDLVVERTGDEQVELQSFAPDELKGMSAEAASEAILQSGWWGALRTRPLNHVARPEQAPQSILISAFETGPAQPGAAELMTAEDAEALQAAVHVLGALTSGAVYLAAGGDHPALSGLSGVERHDFSGPHPAGDPTVQINLVDPPRGTNRVWYMRAWDAVALGHTLLSGRFHAERVYAAVGAGVKTPRLVRTVLGAPMKHIVGDTQGTEQRWIRGSVLTGEAVDANRWAPFYARAIHVLPAEVPRSFLGWALPMLGSWSFHRAFLSGFTRPSRAVDMRPGLYGGERAMVPTGVYGKVVATPDILPEFLFKSVIAGDLEESIQLGLLDMSEEEAALCSYICPSKIEFDVILRDGLEIYEREA